MDNKELHMHSNKILEGNLLDILPTLPNSHFDAVLCDPPYHLTQKSRNGSPQPGDGRITPFGRHKVGTDTSSGTGFMGQTWDGGDIAFRPETWEAVIRVIKPGGYLMAFGGSRTFHRLAVALEDAGFVLVDTLMWFFGSGFPKSRNIASDIDRLCGGVW
jgi:DNA modification methylase